VPAAEDFGSGNTDPINNTMGGLDINFLIIDFIKIQK
jgi:hypothetical protein